MSGTPWWRTYFDDRYFEMHDPLFSEERSRREVAGMRELLGLPVGARVLDAPCGWGRHCALLAEAGCDVVGADISVALLRRADTAQGVGGGEVELKGEGVGVGESADFIPTRYAAADIRFLPFANASFDAVLNVFTSLGLFLSDADDIAALREARRVLVPGGALLLESMHRDDVIASYAERDRWSLPDGTEVRVRRRFDPVTGVSRERLRWRRGDETGRKSHTLRLRSATEIDALLRAAGFDDMTYCGDWDGSPFHYQAESLIAVARVTDD
ncbi:MAG: methyltransferase domain-containing protein [Gemmatimonadetes bacterium]|nr:methyltransferase domain-containing protein [Gemmatimonadota bacterium]